MIDPDSANDETTEHDGKSSGVNDPPVSDFDDTDDNSADGTDDDIDVLASLGKQLLSQIGGIDEQKLAAEAPVPGEALALRAVDDDRLEELADDMLDMMKRLKNLEDTQSRIVTEFNQLTQAIHQNSMTIGREVDQLRKELIGNQKHQASLSIFNTLVPALERFRVMKSGLDPERDVRMVNQMTAVIESLVGTLRALGCNEFHAKQGQPFDPAWMECVGFVDEGEGGTVHSCVKPGFVAGNTLVRPAGVNVVSGAVDAETEDESELNEDRCDE